MISDIGQLSEDVTYLCRIIYYPIPVIIQDVTPSSAKGSQTSGFLFQRLS